MESPLLILACEEGYISEEELEHLTQLLRAERALVRSREPLSLGKYTKKECVKSFRFVCLQLEQQCTELRFPDEFVAENRCTMSGTDALCLLLHRLGYPCMLHDLENEFGKDDTALFRIFNLALDHTFENFDGLLSKVTPDRITEAELEKWARIVVLKGLPFNSCVGFIDETNIEICRPGDYATQKLCYSGYIRRHDLKYFEIMTSCEILTGFYGPYPGSSHDARMLYESLLINEIEASPSWSPPNMEPYHLYGDLGHKATPQLISPFRHNLTPQQILCNKTMSKLRITVE